MKLKVNDVVKNKKAKGWGLGRIKRIIKPNRLVIKFSPAMEKTVDLNYAEIVKETNEKAINDFQQNELLPKLHCPECDRIIIASSIDIKSHFLKAHKTEISEQQALKMIPSRRPIDDSEIDLFPKPLPPGEYLPLGFRGGAPGLGKRK